MGKKISSKWNAAWTLLDLDILGFIDHNITVNVIQNDKVPQRKNCIFRLR